MHIKDRRYGDRLYGRGARLKRPAKAKYAKGKKDKIQKSRGNPDDAEAYVVARARRIDAATMRNSAAAGNVAPATAACHTARPAGRTRRIGLIATGIIAIYIPHPFPHIAAHVIGAKLVGSELSNIVSPRAGV